jgi:NDP-sugar pyrophosphorylase family protein
MRAMVLAAGLGTRLRPLTNERPKALVEVGGRTMLEITLGRLREFGIQEVIINAHHCADILTDYLATNKNFGMSIKVSWEDRLLDTGGGLKKASHFFAGSSEPFLLHNVDVLSNIDFAAIVQVHREREALATLAVQPRANARQLLFDEELRLCGRRITGAATEETEEVVRASARLAPFAFAGIHVISPAIFAVMTEQGAFAIIDAYLRLAGEGAKIGGFRADGYYWRDVGTAESLCLAEYDREKGLIEF